MPTQTAFVGINWPVLNVKTPTLGTMIKHHFPRTIKPLCQIWSVEWPCAQICARLIRGELQSNKPLASPQRQNPRVFTSHRLFESSLVVLPNRLTTEAWGCFIGDVFNGFFDHSGIVVLFHSAIDTQGPLTTALLIYTLLVGKIWLQSFHLPLCGDGHGWYMVSREHGEESLLILQTLSTS